jgi:hypothetical protein
MNRKILLKLSFSWPSVAAKRYVEQNLEGELSECLLEMDDQPRLRTPFSKIGTEEESTTPKTIKIAETYFQH